MHRYKNMLLWDREENSLLVRYEDLVGEAGGGSKDAQKKAIQSILNFLQIKQSDSRISGIIKQCYGVGPTFREGKIKATVPNDHFMKRTDVIEEFNKIQLVLNQQCPKFND